MLSSLSADFLKGYGCGAFTVLAVNLLVLILALSRRPRGDVYEPIEHPIDRLERQSREPGRR